MNAHRTVIEAGPSTIRRLCCGTGAVARGEASEIIGAALGAIDDQVTLVGEHPVAVASLWSDALRSAACTRGEGMIVVHPSWWSSSRVGVVRSAAGTVVDDVLARPRSWLLARAAGADAEATVVVEITERMVVIGGAEVVAVPRRPSPHPFADDVVAAIAGMPAAVVLIDTPSTVTGASTIAASIADAVRANGRKAVRIDDARLARLARFAVSNHDATTEPRERSDRLRSRARRLSGLGAATIVLAAASPAVITVGRHGTVIPPPMAAAPTTFLVEGRVAVTVPADWPTQRVVAGPGSARVQVTSPSDPEVALHVTQSPVAGETLSGTAERLKRAIDAEPAGVFVDFNPFGTSVGRPAVTYREVRAGHHVRWTVLLDGPVRISLGCQSRPGEEEAVRGVCEQAVRSAHAVG
ncbi:Type VII secretion-associated protein [Mycobacterium nebraskense]|uniref:Type VII secretion-associated protein n=1 Tax=Mycobacterium nebraskense TaxID=244292 RepID=A0A1X2A238_9MYCO|nr:type VII secretion-associated protein [Mycobacterium nebraskense]KKC02902.1 Type VII secretion-associated protein [Mycobacterium nebraskense]MCV7120685.1 type VII secretion-associated protein [Mycobacterium nebraskense]ORW35419.1 Type VII secretion-associated protein [Mycobacterium nebraskense]